MLLIIINNNIINGYLDSNKVGGVGGNTNRV